MTTDEEPAELAAFRQEVRAFIKGHLPQVVREKVRRGVLLDREEIDLWERQLVNKGWFVPHWPQRWGGQGMRPEWRMTLDEELARNDCPEASPFGTDMVGPMLMQFGDDAQVFQHLHRRCGGWEAGGQPLAHLVDGEARHHRHVPQREQGLLAAVPERVLVPLQQSGCV